MTINKDIGAHLREPFPEADIEWRLAQCGEKNGKVWASCLAYISARAVQDRLDEVMGISGWQVHYDRSPEGVMAHLSLLIDGNWVSKSDGAEHTEIESFKGGISSALKRVASVWGIGRYLYKLEDNFATIVEDRTKGAYWGKTKEGKQFWWMPPKLPSWAVPAIKPPSKMEQKTKEKTQEMSDGHARQEKDAANTYSDGAENKDNPFTTVAGPGFDHYDGAHGIPGGLRPSTGLLRSESMVNASLPVRPIHPQGSGPAILLGRTAPTSAEIVQSDAHGVPNADQKTVILKDRYVAIAENIEGCQTIDGLRDVWNMNAIEISSMPKGFREPLSMLKDQKKALLLSPANKA